MQVVSLLLLMMLPSVNPSEEILERVDVSSVAEMIPGETYTFASTIRSESGPFSLYHISSVVRYHGVLWEKDSESLTFVGVERFASNSFESDYWTLQVIGDYLRPASTSIEILPGDLTFHFEDMMQVTSGRAWWSGPRLGIDFDFNEQDGEVVTVVVQ
ncbi:hypothetical protein [Lacunimicrobium album]